MNVKKCRYCKATILWAETTTGRPIPLNPAPHPDGTVSLMPAGAITLSAEQVEMGRAIGSRRFRPHAITCPRAKRRQNRPRQKSAP
jgi:hypothetical protein